MGRTGGHESGPDGQNWWSWVGSWWEELVVMSRVLMGRTGGHESGPDGQNWWS